MQLSKSDHRLLKVWVDPAVAVALDDALRASPGGMSTRSEFVTEAIRSLLVDYGLEPSSAPSPGRLATLSASGSSDSPVRYGPWPLEPECARAEEVPGSAAIVADPRLLGMHNRDWPSLRALQVISRLDRGGPPTPRPFGGLVEACAEDAWRVAAELESLERVGELPTLGRGLRHATLLPSNPEKPEASEANYVTFAIGRLSKPGAAGGGHASGPLFGWGALAVLPDGLVSLSPSGWDLLDAVRGLTPALPHPPELARRFLSWLNIHAEVDHGDLMYAAECVSHRPTREELVARIGEHQGLESHSQASTAAGGLVSRLRAWGAVEPGMTEGTYRLTEFGQKMNQEASGARS